MLGMLWRYRLGHMRSLQATIFFDFYRHILEELYHGFGVKTR